MCRRTKFVVAFNSSYSFPQNCSMGHWFRNQTLFKKENEEKRTTTNSGHTTRLRKMCDLVAVLLTCS